MTDWPVVRIGKDSAADLLKANAFTETHRHCETCACDVEPDRQIIHSRVGIVGADHSLEVALANVVFADDVAWVTDLLRHDLAVRRGDTVYRYDVPRPERSA